LNSIEPFRKNEKDERDQMRCSALEVPFGVRITDLFGVAIADAWHELVLGVSGVVSLRQNRFGFNLRELRIS
jgi:hypothetical protein